MRPEWVVQVVEVQSSGAIVAMMHPTIDELYRDHFGDARGLAYALTGSAELAEDLAQDAFLRVAGRVRQLRDPQAFRAYLLRSVVNGVRSHGRHQQVVRRHDVRMAAAAGRAVADEAEAATGRFVIWDALLQLTEKQRTAIVCRYYLDMSERETARALRCPVGTVKSTVARGLEQLRELLGTDIDDD